MLRAAGCPAVSLAGLTLEDLNEAQIKLDITKRQLSESQAALSEGDARFAAKKLNDATSTLYRKDAIMMQLSAGMDASVGTIGIEVSIQ